MWTLIDTHSYSNSLVRREFRLSKQNSPHLVLREGGNVILSGTVSSVLTSFTILCLDHKAQQPYFKEGCTRVRYSLALV